MSGIENIDLQSRCGLNIDYRHDYFHDSDALESFERYAKTIFDLNFGRWKMRGLWDPRYIPFSAFVDGECVASICVYPSDMLIDGRLKKGAQLLTVGTLPEFRMKAIQRKLWKRVCTWIGETCDFVFLFTDDSAAGFYKKLGLKRQIEFSEIIRWPTSFTESNGRFRKLDLDNADDFACLESLARHRTMVSERIGFYNPNLLLFMFLYFYRDCSYYVEKLDAVVVVEEKAERIRVYDIVAEKMPGFRELSQFFSHFKRQEIEFLFCTDRLGIENAEREEITESLLFVSDDFHLNGTFIFPFSIRA